MEQKEYLIGDKRFFQRALTPGQWKQLLPLILKLRIPENPSVTSVIMALGDDLYAALAIVLREDGQKLKDKDLAVLTEFLREEIDGLTTLEVVEDFFTLSPIPLILERLNRVTEVIQKSLGGSNGSTNSSLSSAVEISPKETKSSGNIPSESANPT